MSKLLILLCFIVLTLHCSISIDARKVIENRHIRMDAFVPLSGSSRPILSGAALSESKLDLTESMNVTILIRRNNIDQFNNHLSLIQQGLERHLTREEFEKRYGATQEDMDLVAAFASRYQLSVVSQHSARRTMIVRGSGQNVGLAFNIEFSAFSMMDGASYRGFIGEVSIPSSLSAIIDDVLGLDNRPVASPRIKFAEKTLSSRLVSYTRSQITDMYQLSASNDGSKSTVAIIELGGGFRQTDLTTYFRGLGINPEPNVVAVLVDGANNNPTTANSADGHVMLDIEITGAIASASTIAVYFGPNTDAGFLDAITTAAHDTTYNPVAISISWGNDEGSWSTRSMTSYDSAFTAAAVLGVSSFAASGDDGSSAGGIGNNVDFLDSSPHVTGSPERAPFPPRAIDRRAVVSRHDVLITAATAAALDTDHDVLSVGNGAFAANVDITGLQTFNASYGNLGGGTTLADWGWHTMPFTPGNPAGALREYNMTYYDTPVDGAGRTRRVPYFNAGDNARNVVDWMAGNPHRLNLGQLSLRWRAGAAGNATQALELDMVANASQALRLWSGAIESNYSLIVPPASLCALAEDKTDASFSCGDAGSVITAVDWASYGQPTGSCAAGFRADPACDAAGSGDVLMRMCGGLAWCSVHVDYLAGFGDPCPGQAKRLAANITCAPAPASSSPARPVAPALAGAPVDVAVETAAHPDLDAVAFRLQCSVRGGGGTPCPLGLRLAFPYGSTAFGTSASDWIAPDAAHSTVVVRAGPAGASLLRRLDGDAYRVECAWDSGSLTLTRVATHVFDLLPTTLALAAAVLDVRIACLYAPVVPDARGAFAVVRFPVGTVSGSEWIANKTAATQRVVAGTAPVPDFDALRAAAVAFWPVFWASGAFADFASANTDRSAFELERRVVLSQYLMRVNNAGAEPPQETGLLCNSWNGKHHNEMRFWHLAHWALWGRAELLARSDAFFEEQLANATAYATLQGYDGAHWPKETAAGVNASMFSVPWVGLDHASWPFGGAPNGSLLVWESPQVANALIIWQQPHAIMLAELQRRAAVAAGGAPAGRLVVRRLLPIVLASADYLAARFYFNASDGGGAGRWWLGPPVLGGHETGDAFRTYNPTFEVVYAAHALDLANEWRAAAGLPADPRYDAVAGDLAALPTDPASPLDGPPLYSLDRWCVCMYLPGGTKNPGCKQNWVPPGGSSCDPVTSHPLTVGVLGIVNGRYRGDRYGVDARSANATLAAVLREWVNTWTAAWGWDDALLASAMLRLRWDPRAIVDSALLDPKFVFYKNGQTVCCPTYLPGNGGLLLSVAMLAAGTADTPGGYFPPEWGVVTEGFDVIYP